MPHSTPLQLSLFRLIAIALGGLAFFLPGSGLRAQDADGLTFDGIDDHVTLPPELADSLIFQTHLTLEVRVTFQSLQGSVPIFSFKDDRSQFFGGTFELRAIGGDRNNFATNIAFGQQPSRVAEGTSIQLGREYLVSVVYDGNQPSQDRTKLYIDGVRQQLSGGENDPFFTGTASAGTPIYLGRANSKYSDMTIRELRLWDTARSAQEVAAEHAAKLTGAPRPGLTAFFDFQRYENRGEPLDVLAERTGTGLTGRLHNFAFTSTNSNWSPTASSSQAVLPVELIWFQVHAAGINNRLQWEVASEDGFSHYSVERSADGYSDWRVVETVGAAGAEAGRSKQYTYLDQTPPAAAYYRLRMVDLDGTFEYSDVVLQERVVATEVTLSVYPNPTTGPMTLELATDEAVSLALTDMSGRRVWQRELSAGAAGRASLTPDLAPGVYLLTARSGSSNWTKRLVIR